MLQDRNVLHGANNEVYKVVYGLSFPVTDFDFLNTVMQLLFAADVQPVSCSSKSRLVLPLWYWLTWVVPDKGPLNGCMYV